MRYSVDIQVLVMVDHQIFFFWILGKSRNECYLHQNLESGIYFYFFFWNLCLEQGLFSLVCSFVFICLISKQTKKKFSRFIWSSHICLNIRTFDLKHFLFCPTHTHSVDDNYFWPREKNEEFRQFLTIQFRFSQSRFWFSWFRFQYEFI